MNILFDDQFRLFAKHTPGLPVYECRLAVCFLNVQLIIIRNFSSFCAPQAFAQAFLYRATSRFCQELFSKLFSKSAASNLLSFDTSSDFKVALGTLTTESQRRREIQIHKRQHAYGLLLVPYSVSLCLCG